MAKNLLNKYVWPTKNITTTPSKSPKKTSKSSTPLFGPILSVSISATLAALIHIIQPTAKTVNAKNIH